MRIEFCYGDSQVRVFNRIFWKEVPELEENFEIFSLQIQTQSLTLQLIYIEDEAEGNDLAQWLSFLQENFNTISGVKLMKDDGIILFEGVIDPEAERRINLEDNSLELDFLGVIAQELNEVLPEDITATITGTEFEDGVGSFNDFVSRFFARFLPDYTLIMDPMLTFIDQRIVSFPPFPGYYTHGYKGLWQGKTKLEVLQDLCVLGFCRIVFKNREARFVRYDPGSAKNPDGYLVKDGFDLLAEGAIEAVELNGEIRIPFSYNTGQDPPNNWAGDFYPDSWVRTRVSEFYSNYTNQSYSRQNFTGLNSNLLNGDYMNISNEAYLITEIKRDLAFIEDELQPVQITALKRIS